MSSEPSERTPDVRLPKFFYNKLQSWYPGCLSIKTSQLLASLAVNDFDEKLRKMSKKQLKTFDEKCTDQLNEWASKNYIDPKSRGFKKR